MLQILILGIQSTASFECDGCSHHASFHSMENPREDEIVRRWEAEEKERQAISAAPVERAKKRPRRAIEAGDIRTAQGLAAPLARGLLGAAGILDAQGEGFVEEIEAESESTIATSETRGRRGGGSRRGR
jgi:hypothetical protein